MCALRPVRRRAHAAKRAAGLGDRTTLTDIERVHVAIAYNTGSFKPAKGLQQGFFDGEKFYGEQIFDFLRVAQTVSSPESAGADRCAAAGDAVVTPPTPVTSTGRLLEVDAKDHRCGCAASRASIRRIRRAT